MSTVCVFISALAIGLALLITGSEGQLKQCGSNFINETSGTLQSWNYPFPMEKNIACTWEFGLSGTEIVFLDVQELRLQQGDFLLINDVANMWKYDSTNVSETFLVALSPNGTSVQFTAGPNQTSKPRRFMASFTTKPKENTQYIVAYRGSIKSPLFVPKETYLVYNWIITQRPDTGISLSFKSFNISNGTLTVTSGKDVQTFTGAELPNDLAISNANVKLTLNMSMSDTNQGFNALFSQQQPACTRIETIENSTKVITFDEPVIDHFVRCFVIVEGPPNSVLSAAIQHSAPVQPDANTVIELNDGGSMFSQNLLVYSPTSEMEDPPTVLTSSNRMWIAYVSSPPGKKSLNITVLVTVHNSGESLRDSGTYELSGQSKNTTTVTDTSAFILSVKPDQQVITMVFPNATMGNTSSILFYDGAGTEVLLANFTAEVKNHEVISTSNQMFVIAKDFMENDTFTASFHGSPKGMNHLSVERLGSYQLNSIENSTNYTWIISPLDRNSSEVIALTLGTLRLPESVRLLIYNDSSSEPVDSNLLFSISGAITNEMIYIPALNGSRIVVENSGNATELILDASYVIHTGCHQKINMTDERNVTITSPSYPRLYPANANCSWSIFSEKPVLLTVEILNTLPSQPVLVYGVNNGSKQLLANISGDVSPDDLIIPSDTIIFITFSSLSPRDNITVSTGFKIVLHRLDCGGAVNETVKEFQTPSYPKAEKSVTQCVWLITVPEKKDKNVEIINLAYKIGDEKSSTARIQFYEGGSLQSPLVNMSAVNSTSYLSRKNKLLVEYKYSSDKTDAGSSYKFTYDTYGCSPANMCKNGICLHEGWRCNGVNDCGDFSDEEFCGETNIVTESAGVSVATFLVIAFLMFISGIAVALGGPVLWRKFRSRSGSYQEFRNTAEA